MPVITAALEKIALLTSASTANAALGLLNTYLTWAANQGLLKDHRHSTVDRLPEPSAERHSRKWWKAEEVDLALRCAAEDQNAATASLLVACGCYLGLRPKEIIMQRWQDLDLDAVDPRTNEPRPVCHVTAHSGWKPKGGRNRDIPICAPLLAILRKYRQADGYLLKAEPNRTGRPRGGSKGLAYRYHPRKCWARIIEKVTAAGGTKIDMYGMRHSFASNLLIANVTDVKLYRWLGHADTRMVHRRYGHLLSYDSAINAISKPQ